MPRLDETVKYAKRVIRMTILLVQGKVVWNSYKMALRPGRISVLAVGGGMFFCDQETEDMFFQG
jgi:hypothetical protein